MKVAIIGGGISGLTAAHRLGPMHDVTLFEANDYLGGHTHTVDVEIGGERRAIDTGFIVFNDWTYPRFIELLDELKVGSQPTAMSFSVRCDAADLEYNGSNLNGLFAQRRNLLRPNFHRMLRDVMRFNREGLALALQPVEDRETTVGEFVASRRYSREFVEHYLLPMGAAIWSCPLGKFNDFPIRFIVEFYKNHGLLSIRNRPTWRVIQGGSRTYVTQIHARFRGRMRLRCPITKVVRGAALVVVHPVDQAPEIFEHVVFACHADQALRMLADASTTERDVLSAFPYQCNTAVLHTDSSVLPKRRRAWACWNYHLPGNSNAARGHVDMATVTYQMNLLQGFDSRHHFNVTLNSDERIDPKLVIDRFEYHHPVFTVQRAQAQARHGELINKNHSSFCGAYWGNGFHEDGVVSALAVCDALAGGQLSGRAMLANRPKDAEDSGVMGVGPR